MQKLQSNCLNFCPPSLWSSLHEIYKIAVSNKLFADSIYIVLPSQDTGSVLDKVSAAGTVVEAAVAEIAMKQGPMDSSIESLARFFILKASFEFMTLPNNVKKKLESYFTVRSVTSTTELLLPETTSPTIPHVTQMRLPENAPQTVNSDKEFHSPELTPPPTTLPNRDVVGALINVGGNAKCYEKELSELQNPLCHRRIHK